MKYAEEIIKEIEERSPIDTTSYMVDKDDAWEDYIRGKGMTREEAIQILQGAIKKPNTKDGYLGQAIDMAIKALEQEPKIGHWIKSNIGGAKVCSVCNAHMGLSSFKYCPNCGAKMVEPQENEGLKDGNDN